MKSQIVLAIGAAVTAGVLSQVQPEAVADATSVRNSDKETTRIAPRGDNQARNAGGIGADVIVGELPGVAHWTSGGAVDGMRAYSVATTSCNIGDEILRWEPNNTYHPVIGQNMFRVADGRIEQIGQSWLKHGFCALQLTACGPCQSAGNGCPPMLGIGCSDPYGEFLNGDQPGLGPRFEVNPSTGIFQYPFSNPDGSTGDQIFKRIQVKQSDLLTSNATYFVEGQYIHRDDAAAGNGNNNASYRRVSVNTSNFSVNVQGSTERELPAIYAWGAHGNGTNQPDNDVVYQNIDVPGDGRFILAYKVSENPDGSYHYEYALQNLNSDRAGGSFAVPVGTGATVFNVGFSDVKYHSGEPFDSSPWSATNGSGEVRWSSPKSFVQDPNSNALRWGTMYNYRFDSDAPPVPATLELGLFKGGSPASMSVDILAPGDVDPGGCAADIAQDDGVVDTFDLLFLLKEWGTIGASDADIAGDGTSEPDGVVDTFDLLLLLESWGDC